MFLTSLSEEVHQLEINNSKKYSQSLKKKLVDFQYDGPLVKLLTEVKKIRHEINSPYYKYERKTNGANPVNNFKKNNINNQP